MLGMKKKVIKRGFLPLQSLRSRWYMAKVLTTRFSSLIAYWPMWETSGTDADNRQGTSAYDGRYSNVVLGSPGIGDGNVCPLFDTTAYNLLPADELESVFNGSEGTLMIWAKVLNAGFWTDGAFRYPISFYGNASNKVTIQKSSVDHDLQVQYTAGGSSIVIQKATSTTDWMHIVVTWSKIAEKVYFYLNRVEVNNAGLLGVWGVATLDADKTLIGAYSTTVGTTGWNGYLAHAAVWSTPLNAGQIKKLARV